MSEFQFYKSKEVYREKYYQMPKVFFTSEKYMKLSNDAKIAYMLLKDRFNLSVQNNWVDSEDNIYFIYTVAELMELLNCREGKVTKIKKELENVNLLKQKKGRVNTQSGQIKTTPNRLYLGKAEVTAADVFKIEENETFSAKNYKSEYATVNAKIANTVKDSFDGISAVNAKIANTVKDRYTNDSTVNAKIANNLLYSNNSLDTNRHLIDTEEKDALQNKLLLDNLSTIMTDKSIDTFIPEEVLELIKVFSETYSEAQQTIKTIHNAKYKAQELYNGEVLSYEEIRDYGLITDKDFYITLLKAYQKIKAEKVVSKQGLIFTYVKNWFVEECYPAKHKIHSSESKVTRNWLQEELKNSTHN
ncbi:replication initiator protein A [Enterococcus thailandicus]|uniref:replication initiator protein A n=1 Tax=Enterococcus thailandicus TaxID=417368 RepID=UPI003984F6CC